MVGKTANKRDLARWLARLKKIKTWQLIVILLLVSLLAGIFLRMNNLNMVERRQAVLAADKRGDEQAIKQSLLELQHYVSSHMNTELGGGVDLVHSYRRDRAAAIKQATQANTPAGEAYSQAVAVCKQQFTGGTASFRNDYVQCVVNKTSNIGSKAVEADLPNASMYNYDFATPAWSFDLAGIFVALAALLTLVIVARAASLLLLNLLLKHLFRSI